MNGSLSIRQFHDEQLAGVARDCGAFSVFLRLCAGGYPVDTPALAWQKMRCFAHESAKFLYNVCENR